MPAKKLILLILAILLAFTAIDVVNWYASPEAISAVQTGDVRTLKGESFADTAGQEPFQSIIYYLDAPLKDKTIAILTYYYEDYSSGKNEQRPLKGAKQVVYQIPLDSYAALDCYINANVKIEKITISNESASQVHDRYPIRPLNILIPSAILLAVLFLFIYVKPLNKFIKFVDKKIIDPETRLKGITIAYIILAVAALLHHIYVTMYHKYVLTGYTDLGIPLLIFSIITFLFGKLWRDKVSWILLALLCLKYARTALEGQQILNTTTYIFYMSIYAFFGCYGVARALSRKYWKPFLSALCALWTLAALVLAGIGIFMAINGNAIKNFGSEWFSIDWSGRASFIYQPATAGTILSICMFVSLLGCILTKKRIVQCFYIFASLILFFAGSLTGTRAAYLLSALLLAFMLYIPLRDRLKPGEPKNLALTSGKYVLLFICFLASAAIVAFIHFKSVNLIKFIQVRGGFISTAYAESTANLPEIAQRDLQLSGGWDAFFSGRLTLWGNALEVITSNAKNLLLGQSVYDPMKLVGKLRESRGLMYLYHTHNTLIQNFLELGLPGLLLYLSFIFTTVFHSIRIFRNKELPYWQRMLPIGTLICIAEGFIDNTCHVTYGYPQMTILYLFAGFTIALSRQPKKDSSTL